MIKNRQKLVFAQTQTRWPSGSDSYLCGLILPANYHRNGNDIVRAASEMVLMT